MAIGVFGLQVAYKLKRLEVMSAANTHGWFGGGFSSSIPGPVSTVDRIDFSNDTATASVRGSLSSPAGIYALAATGNSNYGWFGTGYSFGLGLISTVDRIDFSNDAATASPRGPLSLVRSTLTATGNSNYGWFGGGYAPAAYRTTVNRIDFSNDSGTASVRGSLTLLRGNLAATGNSNYGWFGGGGNSVANEYSTVDRIDFSNDAATASPRGSLSAARYGLSATGNSNYGWFGGGNSGAPITSKSFVDRIDFSNDSVTASLRGSLSLARNFLAATGNSNYGWFGGGFAPSIPGSVATADRVDFSNDSATASVRGSLSLTRYYGAATSGQAKGPAIKLKKAGSYGWFGGGRASGAPVTAYSTVDRIDFSNDSTTASVRGSLSSPAGRYALAATGNSNYGWFGGGYTSVASSTVDRIDFSNDSATASVRGSLSRTRYYAAATGNSNYGWFGGGIFPSTNTVERINFANDSATASPRGVLSASRYQFTATGNSNYGWFAGGVLPAKATIDRIDFSNDSVSASVRGPLSAAKYNSAAAGNRNYGWIGGGGGVSTVDRINFANDSATTSVRGPLSGVSRGLGAAAGNSNYGWFGGGKGGSPLAVFQTVDRIDFSNDAATASPRGLLSGAKYYLSATSNRSR